jgi:hypothetical protein
MKAKTDGKAAGALFRQIYFSRTFSSTRWFARSASLETALMRGCDFP